MFRCPFQKPVKIRVLSGFPFTISTNEVLPATSYGYNGWGTSDSTRSLGLGGRAETAGGALSPTLQAAVTAPVDMVAFGDGFYRDSAPQDPRQLTAWHAILSPWHRDEMTSQPTFKAHRGKLNRAFCDGHVEAIDMNQPFRRFLILGSLV